MPGRLSLDPDALFGPIAHARAVGLAVSGGADSLALMLLAARWRAARAEGPALVVYSVDHALRPEAAAEVRFVLATAGRLGLAARGLRWDGDKPREGLQAAARDARYRLIAAAMQEDGVEFVLTAHHLRDQAETVLMRLAHGSGVTGLRGMDEVSTIAGCRIVRPLLGVHPEALVAFVAEAGLVPVADPSNEDAAYERVRWRRALPGLEAMGLTIERLGGLARRMAHVDSLIGEAADAAYAQLVTPVSGTCFELPHGRVAVLNPQVAVALLGDVLGVVSGDRSRPSLGALEALHRRLAEFVPTKPTTLHGCILSSDGATLVVRRERARRGARKPRSAATAD